MIRVQMTSKGQVTIPVELRRELGLAAGEELLLEVEREAEHLTLRRPASLPSLYRSAPATRPYPGRTEVREQAARKAAARKLQAEVGRAA